MKIKYVVTVLLVCFAGRTLAQQGWDWGEDKPEAQGNWVYVNGHMDAGEYEKTLPKLYWLLNNTPNLHESLYIQAIKAYEKVEKSTKDPERKKVLQDSVLWLYDTRVEKYNDKANVYNRKGLVAFNYLIKRDGTTEELFDLYKKIFELNESDAFPQHAYYYMYVAARMNKLKKITDEDLQEIYFMLSDFIEDKMNKAPANQQKTYHNIQQQLDSLFEKNVEMTCEKIENIFGKRFEENPEDLDIAKKIQRLSITNSCYNDFLLKAIHLKNEKEPGPVGFKNEAKIHSHNKNYEEAVEDYEKAAELAEDDEFKAEMLFEVAKMNYEKLGRKSTARSYARKVISTGKLTKEAYKFIGDMYFYSFEDCKTSDVVKTRSIYIAAYDMYEKAGASAKMKEAEKNFPSSEEIFQQNKEIGDPVETGCWINETVNLKKR